MPNLRKNAEFMKVTVGWSSAMWWILACSVIFAGVSPASAQARSSRKDILKGRSGEDSCTLQRSMEATCPSSLTAPADNPMPSQCSCNNMYFNLWSSCLLSSGHATLPTYSNWTLSCRSLSIAMQFNPESLAVNVPKWAVLPVPGDMTFDVQAAVLIANPQGWTPLQMALPWCSAAFTLITTLAFIKLWRRSTTSKATPFNQRFTLSLFDFRFGSHRVRDIDTRKVNGEWSIDSPSERGSSIKSPNGPGMSRRKETYESYVFVDRTAPDECSPISPTDTIPAHPSIPSVTASQATTSMATDSAVFGSGSETGKRRSDVLRGAIVAAVGRRDDHHVLTLDLTEGEIQPERPPGGLVPIPGMNFHPQRTTGPTSVSTDSAVRYPFSSQASGFGSTNTRNANLSAGLFDSLKSIGGHMPWKRRPPRVESMKPTRRFRIDQPDQWTKASSSEVSSAGEATRLGEHEDPELGIQYATGGGIGESSVGYGDADEDDERQTLIADSERRQSSVLMIGNPRKSAGLTNVSSSVDSHIEIVSATSGTGSYVRSVYPTNSSLLSTPSVPALPIMLPPPLPVQPPPVPAPYTRYHLRDPPLASSPPPSLSRDLPSSPPRLADIDPRGFTSNHHIQTQSFSKLTKPSFNYQDLGASESPLAPPPGNRFHAMTPIQEDARSYAGRSSPAPSSINNTRPSSPSPSYTATSTIPYSASSSSPSLSQFPMPPVPRGNQSGDSGRSINVLSPNSTSDHSRSESITSPTSPLNVGIRRKTSNDTNILTHPSSTPLSSIPSTSPSHGIMQIVSMNPRQKAPSELVRSSSNDSQSSNSNSKRSRPLPSPGLSQGGSQHQKSLSQNDIASTSQPFRSHTPTLSGSGVTGMGSPHVQAPSHIRSPSTPHHVAGDGFAVVLTASEISRTTGAHRRGLGPDDRSSFYMTADPLSPVVTRPYNPHIQRRAPMSDDIPGVGRYDDDPMGLVPAAVRGAGYRIDKS